MHVDLIFTSDRIIKGGVRQPRSARDSSKIDSIYSLPPFIN